MELKETRGRKAKFEYKLRKGQSMSLPYTKSHQVSIVAMAKRRGHKIRTWRDGDILFIKRVM